MQARKSTTWFDENGCFNQNGLTLNQRNLIRNFGIFGRAQYLQFKNAGQEARAQEIREWINDALEIQGEIDRGTPAASRKTIQC